MSKTKVVIAGEHYLVRMKNNRFLYISLLDGSHWFWGTYSNCMVRRNVLSQKAIYENPNKYG